RWWLLRSISVTSNGRRASAFARLSPPKPPPTMTTRDARPFSLSPIIRSRAVSTSLLQAVPAGTRFHCLCGPYPIAMDSAAPPPSHEYPNISIGCRHCPFYPNGQLHPDQAVEALGQIEAWHLRGLFDRSTHGPAFDEGGEEPVDSCRDRPDLDVEMRPRDQRAFRSPDAERIVVGMEVGVPDAHHRKVGLEQRQRRVQRETKLRPILRRNRGETVAG